MKRQYLRSLLLIVSVGLTLGAVAQPGTGPGGGTPILGPPPASTVAPIDDGAIFFLLAVAGYAYYLLGQRKAVTI